MEAVIAPYSPDQSVSPHNKAQQQIKTPSKRNTRYHTMKASGNNNSPTKSNQNTSSLGRFASFSLPNKFSNSLSSFSYNGHNRFPQPQRQPQQQPQPPLLPLPILPKPPQTQTTQHRSRSSRDLSTSPVSNRKLTARKPAKPVTSATPPAKPAFEPVTGPLGPEPEELPNAIFTLAPPPSSLPLPRFSLRPKLGCNVEAGVDVGATDNLRRLLRLP